MTDFPETQLSLILRLPRSAQGQIDQAAWQEFVDVYEPFLYRFARRRGLQDSDARETVQRVLLAVAQSISRWQPYGTGNTKPRFRNWLFTIARHQVINAMRARRFDDGSGSTTQLTQLYQMVEPSSPLQTIEEDYRREAFLWAAARVKGSVNETTWQAFWKTSVDDQPCSRVANDLGISVGAVYAARFRVLAKLKAEVQTLEDLDETRQHSETRPPSETRQHSEAAAKDRGSVEHGQPVKSGRKEEVQR